MNCLTAMNMRAAIRHDPKLKVPASIWQVLLSELYRRTEEWHESGAFLLGRTNNNERTVEQIIYYDDIDPHAYDSGVVIMHASSFSPLWQACQKSGLSVVADIHVHPEEAWQSIADQYNPMIALAGHIALIIPYFAYPPVLPETLGFYEYLGSHQWRNFSGEYITQYLHIVDEEI